ncbi:MAG: type I DNA topoisomerase [Candidatus Kapaibacterium sp.]
MEKSLVIVESPAKAKTINKYLGSDFIVEASVGHVKDLPKDGLSIDVEGGFIPTYEVIRGKQDIVKRLRSLAGRCSRVYLATDPDREGEAIAHHIAEEIKGENRNIQRVLFNEITKSGVTSAMRSPRDIDRHMVEAQEARRVMDRLIGYKVSPYLWRRFTGEGRGLSAGRVQSVALRLVVERERAINSFIPIEYWGLVGHFRTKDNQEITARLVRFDGTEIRNPSGSALDLKDRPESLPFISTGKQAESLRDRALKESYAIASIGKKEVKRNAPLPFTTSTLQQEASRRLKMNTGRTMKVAQQLYEGVELGKQGRVGLITYMRTDSTRISDEAVAAAEGFIYNNYGKEYLPPSRPKTKEDAPVKKKPAKAGANVQDAHEAVRPADVMITPKEARKSLDKELADLYELIWSRFVASQMAAAIFDQTTVEIEGGPFLFRATGRITRFKGWMQVYADDEEEKETRKGKKSDSEGEDEGAGTVVLPENIRKGNELALEKIDTRQSFTKPPLRYTESLLVKELEAKGIGRPSTYSAIITTIQDRGYVEQTDRKLHATELGMKVCDALVAGFPALFDMKFTAKMEGDLDTIAGGKTTYLKVMQGFYAPLEKALGGVAALGPAGGRGITAPSRGAERPKGVKSSVLCNKCGGAMELRVGNYGHYLACLAFPACRNIISATEDGAPKQRYIANTGEAAGGTVSEAPAEICEKCGAPMRLRKAKSGSEFYGCTTYPACTATKPVSLGITCPSCDQGSIVSRTGGRYSSIFYACTRYPECRFTSSQKPVNRPCAKCGNKWLVEGFEAGEGNFIECPRCKARE